MRDSYQEIKETQLLLIEWAKAYEETGEALVEDFEYDAMVRLIARLEADFPEDWQAINNPAFRDGSYKYTGLFYKEAP